MPRSTKQKEKIRDRLVSSIRLLSCLRRDEDWDLDQDWVPWDLNPDSFRSSEYMPIDHVELNPRTNSYQFNYRREESADDDDEEEEEEEKEEDDENHKTRNPYNVKEDDFIAQAMIMYWLYRLEKGWGLPRSCQGLSIWCGKPPKQEEDTPFPLKNLWAKEIEELIANKKLGKNRLGHTDNFCEWEGMRYSSRKSRKSGWPPEPHRDIGLTLAHQATIQIALYLHKNVSVYYAMVAALLIHYALQVRPDDEFDIMTMLVESVKGSARKESDNFAKIALDDIERTIQDLERLEQSSSSPRKKPKTGTDEKSRLP